MDFFIGVNHTYTILFLSSHNAFYWTIFTDVSGCDVTLNVTDVKQYVSTEGYPDSYENHLECRFNFVAPPGEKIVVLFEDVDLHIGRDFIRFRKSSLSFQMLKKTRIF